MNLNSRATCLLLLACALAACAQQEASTDDIVPEGLITESAEDAPMEDPMDLLSETVGAGGVLTAIRSLKAYCELAYDEAKDFDAMQSNALVDLIVTLGVHQSAPAKPGHEQEAAEAFGAAAAHAKGLSADDQKSLRGWKGDVFMQARSAVASGSAAAPPPVTKDGSHAAKPPKLVKGTAEQQYHQAMDEVRMKFSGGIGKYLLSKLAADISKGESVIGPVDMDGKTAIHMVGFQYADLGLKTQPSYFQKLAVKSSAYQSRLYRVIESDKAAHATEKAEKEAAVKEKADKAEKAVKEKAAKAKEKADKILAEKKAKQEAAEKAEKKAEKAQKEDAHKKKVAAEKAAKAVEKEAKRKEELADKAEEKADKKEKAEKAEEKAAKEAAREAGDKHYKELVEKTAAERKSKEAAEKAAVKEAADKKAKAAEEAEKEKTTKKAEAATKKAAADAKAAEEAEKEAAAKAETATKAAAKQEAKEKADEQASKEATTKHNEGMEKSAAAAEAAEKTKEKAAKDAEEKADKKEKSAKAAVAAEKTTKANEVSAKEGATKEVATKENSAKEKESKKPVIGSCECSVSMYYSLNYGGICQTHTLRKGAFKTSSDYSAWVPHSSCRSDVNSIRMSDGCRVVNIIDDDDGSWGKYRQDVPMYSSMSDLPNDVEDDVRGLDVYPKMNCCIKNCRL